MASQSEGEQTQPNMGEPGSQSKPENVKEGKKREGSPLENPEQHRARPANASDSLHGIDQPVPSTKDESNSSEIEVVDTRKARQATATSTATPSTDQAARARDQEATETPNRPRQGPDPAQLTDSSQSAQVPQPDPLHVQAFSLYGPRRERSALYSIRISFYELGKPYQMSRRYPEIFVTTADAEIALLHKVALDMQFANREVAVTTAFINQPLNRRVLRAGPLRADGERIEAEIYQRLESS